MDDLKDDILQKLETQMALQRAWNPGMEDRISWQGECGVIISYNEAQYLFNLLKQKP